VALLPLTPRADDDRLPATVQAVIFKKVFGFDRDFEGKPPRVLVVHQDDVGDAEKVVAAFAAVGIDATSMKAAAASASVSSFGVVYFTGGASPATLKDICTRNHVLTIAGVPSLAVRGEVSIAVGRKADGKPEITVNLRSTKAEGHTISSSLLALANVIQ
jgi:hypothetical protein